jgi:hypothetical protein
MESKEACVCQGRIVRAGYPERLVLRTPEGLFPLEYGLVGEGFQAGDLVEVRLIEHDPQFGVRQWIAASSRG